MADILIHYLCAYRYTPINAANVKERSELLLEQYGKTGSLFPHNVVLVPLGDDFTYNHEVEWDQQYSNYKQLMDYINENDYNAEVKFGTLSGEKKIEISQLNQRIKSHFISRSKIILPR